MTNDEGSPKVRMTKQHRRFSAFGFRHSFVITHSSFVIFRALRSLALEGYLMFDQNRLAHPSDSHGDDRDI
jgi:hypothetical protein